MAWPAGLLAPLAESAAEYQEVAQAVHASCSQMHGTFLQVTAIYKVVNAAIDSQFAATVATLHSPSRNRRKHLFHGVRAVFCW
eukprot:COSAG01_NODE_254_length_20214_cov_25.086254_16_plen_83_part_00